MILKFLKKNQILLFILLLLISVVIIFLTKTSDMPRVIKPEIKEENTTLQAKPIIIPKLVTKLKKKNQLKDQNSSLKTSILNDKIDFIGNDKPLIYTKPTLEIDQIMIEHQKINTFAQEKYILEKKEDWKINYEIGLEDDAIENLKIDNTLKTEMINGKIEFSTSF